MTFGELVDEVIRVTGLGPGDAAKVAVELEGQDPSERVIQYAATMLGLESEATPAPDEEPGAPVTLEQQLHRALAANHLESDPAEVLQAVYRECPRVLAVNPPRIGRVPKDSAFHDSELQELLAQLPESVRLLIGSIDLLNGEATLTLYDEANDLDRRIGPIDLRVFDSPEALNEAVTKLMSRLPRVLAADHN